MPKSIKTKIDRFDSNLWHFHLVIPQKFAHQIIDGTNRRVVATINKTIQFQAALMPLGDGDYFININQQIRKKLKLVLFGKILKKTFLLKKNLK